MLTFWISLKDPFISIIHCLFCMALWSFLRVLQYCTELIVSAFCKNCCLVSGVLWWTQVLFSCHYKVSDFWDRVPWEQGVTFDATASSFADLTYTKYGRVSEVFDGYSASTPSIKGSEHHRVFCEVCMHILYITYIIKALQLL